MPRYPQAAELRAHCVGLATPGLRRLAKGVRFFPASMVIAWAARMNGLRPDNSGRCLQVPLQVSSLEVVAGQVSELMLARVRSPKIHHVLAKRLVVASIVLPAEPAPLGILLAYGWVLCARVGKCGHVGIPLPSRANLVSENLPLLLPGPQTGPYAGSPARRQLIVRAVHNCHSTR